jgi:hypothetical protein
MDYFFCRYNDSDYRDYFYRSFDVCTSNRNITTANSGFGHTCKNPASSDPEEGAWSTINGFYFIRHKDTERSNLINLFPDASKDIICVRQGSFEGLPPNASFTGKGLRELQEECRASVGEN